MQDGKCRTCCCPGIVVKFSYIATAALIKNIFKSSKSVEVTMRHWETGAIPQNTKKE